MGDLSVNNNQTIGENLKRLRTERQLSLGQLADACGLSKVILSQIEKGEANPTINTIWKIAKGLRVHYTEILDHKTEETTIVHKEDAAAQTERGGDYTSYSYYNASPNRAFDLFVIELKPGKKHLSHGHLPGSKEYLLVNRGNANIIVGNDCYAVKEGDSVCFDGDKGHTYINTGSELLSCTSLVYY